MRTLNAVLTATLTLALLPAAAMAEQAEPALRLKVGPAGLTTGVTAKIVPGKGDTLKGTLVGGQVSANSTGTVVADGTISAEVQAGVASTESGIRGDAGMRFDLRAGLGLSTSQADGLDYFVMGGVEQTSSVGRENLFVGRAVAEAGMLTRHGSDSAVLFGPLLGAQATGNFEPGGNGSSTVLGARVRGLFGERGSFIVDGLVGVGGDSYTQLRAAGAVALRKNLGLSAEVKREAVAGKAVRASLTEAGLADDALKPATTVGLNVIGAF